jgi:hypothetical protein
MQNTISILIAVFGLAMALAGAWLAWGGWGALVVAGFALFAFGLVSIECASGKKKPPNWETWLGRYIWTVDRERKPSVPGALISTSRRWT